MRVFRRLEVEALEVRLQLSAGIRSIDGTGNNVAHPNWGSAGVDLLRVAPAGYADGVSAPAGSDRPGARAVSNVVADQGGQDVLNSRMLSAMIYAWGQFVDHDLDLTPTAKPSQPFNVSVPTGDPSFDPQGTGTQVIPLNRSASDPATGTGAGNPRQQINAITAWLDGSQIYGSDAASADKLRTHQGGLLKTSAGNLLPYNDAATFPTGTLPMANDAHLLPDSQMFAAGDVRANENVELLSLQTLFVREHNRIAVALAKANPGLDDETLYQTARSRVIAELQVITYKEWLPALLGPDAVKPYQGYNPNVNPGIATEFSTAAFRFGHSLLGDDIEFLDNNGNAVASSVTLAQAFFNPPLLTAHGIDPLLKYLSSDVASEVDTKVVDSVRNFLFGPPGAGGMDLASLNIQRGRDHGLADYNSMRAASGLPRVTAWSQITSDKDLQAKLKQVYGSVDNVDAWVGGLAEDHVAGSSVGPLFRRIIADQFQRLRDGDRFWYQRVFSGWDLQDLERTTLADVIRRNTGVTNLQGNVFFFRETIGGTVFGDANRNGRPDHGERGLAGHKVDLLNADTGEVIATTTTDAQGRYHFDTLNGLSLGRYQLRVDTASGEVQTTQDLPTINLTRGDQFPPPFAIGVAPAGQGAPPPRTPRAPTGISPMPRAQELFALDTLFASSRK